MPLLHTKSLRVASYVIGHARRVQCSVAVRAQGDQIALGVISRLAPPDHVVDLQLIAPAAVLAFPTVPLENFQLELAVNSEVEPKPPSIGKVATHADRLMSRRNCCCCEAGRNPKNRRRDITSTSIFPFSRFAPARKSAQIISRQ